MQDHSIENAIKPLLNRLRSIRNQTEWLVNEPSVTFNTDFLYVADRKAAFFALNKLKAEIERLLLLEDYTARSPVPPKNAKEQLFLNEKVRAELQEYLRTIITRLDEFGLADPVEVEANVFELPENWSFADAIKNDYEPNLETAEVALLLHYLKEEGFIIPFEKQKSLHRLAHLFGRSDNTVKQCFSEMKDYYSERESLLKKLSALSKKIEKDMESAKRRVTIEKKEPLK